MSALAAVKSSNFATTPPQQAEADLRSEATCIEQLRKQINQAGAQATKESLAEFARRQKAYLDRKIELEKLKRNEPAAKAEEKAFTKPVEPPKPTIAVERRAGDKAAPEVATSPVRKVGSIQGIVWVLLAVAAAVAAWHLLCR